MPCNAHCGSRFHFPDNFICIVIQKLIHRLPQNIPMIDHIPHSKPTLLQLEINQHLFYPHVPDVLCVFEFFPEDFRRTIHIN